MKGSDQPVQIAYHYDQEYWDEVDQANPNGWIDVSITIGSEQIYGRDDSGVRGRACTTTLELLESVAATIRGEPYVVEFEFGPSWLAVEPADDEMVRIVRCSTFKGAKNPDERLDIDSGGTLRKDAWCSEVLRIAGEFHRRVIEQAPELAEDDALRAVQEKIEDVDQGGN